MLGMAVTPRTRAGWLALAAGCCLLGAAHVLGVSSLRGDLSFLNIEGAEYVDAGRGLHSCTFQLNLSALYGIEGARRGCVAHIWGVLGGI
jgi:hypothetical protein